MYMREYRFIFIYKNCSKFYWRARLHTIHLNANILWRTPRSSFNCIFILYGVLQLQSSGFRVYIRVQRTTKWTCMSIHNNGWSKLNMFWKSLFSICLISPFVTHFYWIKNTFVSGICTTVCIINNPATFRCFFFHCFFFAVAKQWKQRKIGNSKIKNSNFFLKKIRSNGWGVFMSHCMILVWRRFLAFQQFRPLTKRNPWYFCGCLSWHMQKPIHNMKLASRQRPRRQRKATRSSPSSAYQKCIKPYKRLFFPKIDWRHKHSQVHYWTCNYVH